MNDLSGKNVLDLIRTGRAETQADICKVTGMSSSTVSCIVKRLKEADLIEVGGQRVQGRGKPMTLLRFAPPGYFIAVDIDGSQTEVGLLSLSGEIVAEELLEVGQIPDPEKLLKQVHGVARRIMKKANVPGNEVRAVGINVNGFVNANGVLEFSTVLPWRNVPLVNMAKNMFGMTAYCSDGRMRSVAEYCHGAGQGSEVMLFFNVADGVSARPVIEGQLFRGSHHRSGEIGHVVVNPNGPHCGCGQQGCLEAMISGPALARRVASDAESWSSSWKTQLAELSKLALANRAAKTVQELVRLAEEVRHPYAQRLVDEVIGLAGRALGSAVACFDPDCIVVDGYVFHDRPSLLHRLWQSANSQFNLGGAEMVRLTPAMLGHRAKFLSLVTLVGDGLADSGKLTG